MFKNLVLFSLVALVVAAPVPQTGGLNTAGFNTNGLNTEGFNTNGFNTPTATHTWTPPRPPFYPPPWAWPSERPVTDGTNASIRPVED